MPETILCHFCKERPKTQVKGGQYCCDICNPPPVFSCGFVEKEFLRGYGYESKARLKALDERVAIPHKDGSWSVGRLKGGKIREQKPPDIRP